jgi:hypothetical protein
MIDDVVALVNVADVDPAARARAGSNSGPIANSRPVANARTNSRPICNPWPIPESRPVAKPWSIADSWAVREAIARACRQGFWAQRPIHSQEVAQVSW